MKTNIFLFEDTDESMDVAFQRIISEDWKTALGRLLGVYYSFHLQYPASAINSLTFFERKSNIEKEEEQVYA